MIIDTSAIVAIFFRERDALPITRAILRSNLRMMLAATFVESGIVAVGKKGEGAVADMNRLIDRLGIRIVDTTRSQADAAHRGFVTFGKGRHPARLNFGDCFAYALAKTESMPLLFRGDDFARTDIAAVKT